MTFLRLPLTSVFLCIFSLNTISCKRLENKLERLKKIANGEEVEPASPTPLTQEQIDIVNLASNSSQFDLEPTPKIEPISQTSSVVDTENTLPTDLFLTKTSTVPTSLTINKQCQVSILGYHDFFEIGGHHEHISLSKFSEQMQFIKDSGIPVISLQELISWKKEKINIPERAYVITMDDGWSGVYKHAFPILKKHQFPFTIFLYKNFVNSGARSLSWQQIREMMDSGCTVGSHSVSHKSLKPNQDGNTPFYQEWLQKEFVLSKQFLEENLKQPCTSFAFPFGIYSDDIAAKGISYGYDACLTVNGKKITWDTPLDKLDRFIIYGDSDFNFNLATTFRSPSLTAPVIASQNLSPAEIEEQKKNKLSLFTIHPQPHSIQTQSSIQFSVFCDPLKLNINPQTLKLVIAGYGVVPAEWDAANFTLHYQHPFNHPQTILKCKLIFQWQESNQWDSVDWQYTLPPLYTIAN
jgi:peptidoglycan/xylan/chitin deacetylase (PgdA/CDA1 family)